MSIDKESEEIKETKRLLQIGEEIITYLSTISTKYTVKGPLYVTAEELVVLARIKDSGILADKPNNLEITFSYDEGDLKELGVALPLPHASSWLAHLSRKFSSLDELTEELSKIEGVTLEPGGSQTDLYNYSYDEPNISLHIQLANPGYVAPREL